MANGGKKGSAGDFENIFGSLVTKAGFTGVFEEFFLRGAKTRFECSRYDQWLIGAMRPVFFDILFVKS